MKISVHFHSEKGTHREKYDCGRSSKSKVGPRPLAMSKGHFVLGTFRDRVDLRNKVAIAKAVRELGVHFQGDTCTVHIEHPEIEKLITNGVVPENTRYANFGARNPHDFSNAVARYILGIVKGSKFASFGGDITDKDADTIVKLMSGKRNGRK